MDYYVYRLLAGQFYWVIVPAIVSMEHSAKHDRSEAKFMINER